MKGNPEMSRQPEISDKSTRNDPIHPNKQEDAKTITVISHPVPTPSPSPTSVGALARRDESLYGIQTGPDSDDSSSRK